MANPHKTSHCNEKSITVYYTESQKHSKVPYASEKVETIQLYGNSSDGITYQDRKPSIVYESDVFSPYQNRLYKQALHGLAIYTDVELSKMTFRDKLKIENLHRRAQRILNEWKQSIVSTEIDKILLSMFHKSKILRKEFIEKTQNYTNNALTNYQTFAELRITRVDIARKLVDEGVLPPLFFNLNPVE